MTVKILINSALLKSLFGLFLFFPVPSFASPNPGLGSSVLSSQRQAVIFNVKGFSLSSTHTPWNWESESHSKNELSVIFRNPQTHGSLTLKTESLSRDLSLEAYGHKWLRDYPSYGFEVQGAKVFQQANARGYVIDLFHKSEKKLMRQIVFLNNKTAVILTCSDKMENYNTTLATCNSIIKTFRWL